MVILAFALLGLLVGVALDALIARLAVAPDEDDDAEAPGDFATMTPAHVHGEGGSLILSFDTSPQAWTRRLLVMAASAGLFAAASARFDDPAHLALACAYASVLLVCAATDALAYRVPNAVTYPAIAGALFAGALLPEADLVEVLAGGALAGGVLLAPALLTGGAGMGMGDVKLAAFVGLALGFTHVVPALLFMALGGGAAAALLLVTGLRKRGEPIPYAPFISAGALATLLWQGAAFVDLA